jgi:hypothetical protein
MMPSACTALTARTARTSRAALLSAVCVSAALSLSSLGTAAAPARPVLASAASACRISGHERDYGPTYVTYIGVSGGASCGQAGALVRSYYRCRVRHGGRAGHCSATSGFRCSEQRTNVIPTQYDARVSCSRGHERIRHNYTQFT